MTDLIVEKNVLEGYIGAPSTQLSKFISTRYMSIFNGDTACPQGKVKITLMHTVSGAETNINTSNPAHLMICGVHNFNDTSMRRAVSWPCHVSLASLSVDVSNCGIAYFHNINNHTLKGLGTLVLSCVENYFAAFKRKYIQCSVSKDQVERYGVDKWLEKRGYTKSSEFIGGNSGDTCWIYYKDIRKTPPIIWKELSK